MSTVDKKLSQRAETTEVDLGYSHIIIPNGSIYESKKISTENRIKAENGQRSYKKVFSNADLVDNVLSVNHGKNTSDLQLSLRDPNGTFVDISQIATVVDDNNISIDFGGAIDTGNWILLITFWIQ